MSGPKHARHPDPRYIGVDLDEVWNAASSRVPELRAVLEKFLAGERARGRRRFLAAQYRNAASYRYLAMADREIQHVLSGRRFTDPSGSLIRTLSRMDVITVAESPAFTWMACARSIAL